jgi:hypothetical protein
LPTAQNLRSAFPWGKKIKINSRSKAKAKRPDSRPDFAGVPHSTLSLQEGRHVFDSALSCKELGARIIERYLKRVNIS